MGNNFIKLVQRKWSNVSGSNKTQIFKLNGDCFEELFDYLPLKDLHSLGQTCKSMQQMTGKFFKRNYSAAECNVVSDGIYLINFSYKNPVQISGFIEFITSIAIGNNLFTAKLENRTIFTRDYHYYYILKKFEYIKLHADKFKSVKKLSLTDIRLNERTVGYILKILPNIEILELVYSTVTLDLYDVLLKYCKNLRQIKLSEVTFETEHNWLHQRYEKLECFELDGNWGEHRINDLSTFFERNSNIRSFSCDTMVLMSNKDAFLNSIVKLDTFELKENVKEEFFDEKSTWDLLHQLHTNGFFKCLHINARTKYLCNRFSSVQLSGQLSVDHIDLDNFKPFSTRLIEFAETSLPYYITSKSGKSINEIYVKQLMNVERLYLCREGLDIMHFIKKFPNLKKIKVHYFESAEILQLDLLNTEREKLAGAQKVTIYVPDAVFLATKWATKNGTTNFSLIEMKRTDSYEWNRSLYGYLWKFCNELRLPPGIK